MISVIIALLPFIESINRQIGYVLLLILGYTCGVRLFGKKIRLDFTEEVFGLFLLATASGIPFSWSISNSINELLRYAVYFIVFVYVRRSRWILKSPPSGGILAEAGQVQDDTLGKIIILPAVLLSVISLIYLLPFKLLPYPVGGLHLFLPTFGHNHLSGLLLFALPVSIYRYIDKHEKRWGLLTAFLLISLIFTYSRVAYIIVLFYLFVLFRKNASRYISYSIIAIAVFYIILRLYSNIGIRLDFLPKQIFKPVAFENVRLGYWKHAIEGFKLSPVFGTGLDTFRYVSNRFASSQKSISLYAHNHILSMFTEAGIIGGSLFLVLIIFPLIKIIKSHNFKSDNLPLFLGVCGSVLNNLLDYDWQIYSLFLYFWIALGLLLPKPKVDKDMNSAIITGFVSMVVMVSTLMVILEIVPWDANHNQKTANLALINNQIDEARKYNDAALQLDPNNTDFLVFRGNLEDVSGDIKTSRKYFIKAIMLSPYGLNEVYRELLNTYISEAQKYFDEGKIPNSKKVLVIANGFFPYLILIDIQKDFHSQKAIRDALKYIKNKAGYYKFQPDDISYTYNLIKNDIDNRSGRNVF